MHGSLQRSRTQRMGGYEGARVAPVGDCTRRQPGGLCSGRLHALMPPLGPHVTYGAAAPRCKRARADVLAMPIANTDANWLAPGDHSQPLGSSGLDSVTQFHIDAWKQLHQRR